MLGQSVPMSATFFLQCEKSRLGEKGEVSIRRSGVGAVLFPQSGNDLLLGKTMGSTEV